MAYMKHKQIRKVIKQDALQHGLERGAAFFKAHLENILISLVIAGVLAVLVPMYFKHAQDGERRAAGLYNRASGFYRQAVPSEYAKTVEEKYTKCRDMFDEVTKSFPNTSWAPWARLGSANCQFFLKAYEPALAVYRAEAEKNKSSELRPAVVERIGACQEGLGKWGEALATYQSLLAGYPDYFNRRSVRLGMARAYQGLNQPDAAAKILEAESRLEPGTYWADAARFQLLFQTSRERP